MIQNLRMWRPGTPNLDLKRSIHFLMIGLTARAIGRGWAATAVGSESTEHCARPWIEKRSESECSHTLSTKRRLFPLLVLDTNNENASLFRAHGSCKRDTAFTHSLAASPPQALFTDSVSRALGQRLPSLPSPGMDISTHLCEEPPPRPPEEA